LLILGSALVVAAAVLAAAFHLAATMRASGEDRTRTRALELIGMFAPAISAADSDPRAILTWEPLARTARQMFPAEFARLDAASGGRFPFDEARVEAAHAKWTADWLAWEHAHDGEFKLKAAAVEQQMTVAGSTPVLRAELDAIERQKLELYQRRYGEYVRVARSLQALVK
jgi:hypothetical protein